MVDEKTTLNELLKAENSLAVKYAVMLCSAVNSDIRTKLTLDRKSVV